MEFKTPVSKRTRARLLENPDLNTPIRIPPTPFLEQIGYGCGVGVFTLERSPKVGFVRSPWAIKKRNKKDTKDLKYNARIKYEADIMRKLKHPNIIGFRGFTYSDNGEPCLAMEKLDISLGDMIEERVENGEIQFPASEIIKIGYEIAKGLEYLHHHALILHGDIKSYNILVTKDFSTVKICDFGVSVPLTKSLEMDTSNEELSYIGTECWNAPEIINEQGPVTNKADIWAYGLVLWEMIALSPPHVEIDDDNLMDISEDDSLLECKMLDSSKENIDSNQDMDKSFLEFMKFSSKNTYGTRPPLPAIELGSNYDRVLEIFYICTDEDYKTRPSAKGVVRFFENYIQTKSN